MSRPYTRAFEDLVHGWCPVWEGLGAAALLEEVRHRGQAAAFSELLTIPYAHSPCFVLSVENVTLGFPSLPPRCPYVSLSTVTTDSDCSGTVRPEKLFLL